MVTLTIRTLGQLLDLVGASNQDPDDPGPVVVHATWTDGRTIRASYYRGHKETKPDAETRFDVFYDTGPLKPLVTKLLTIGTPFVTVTGTNDQVCCLEWSISQS